MQRYLWGNLSFAPGNFEVVNVLKADHIKIVMEGTGMSLLSSHLSDNVHVVVVTYERSSWGNKGDVVKPSEMNGQNSIKEEITWQQYMNTTVDDDHQPSGASRWICVTNHKETSGPM